MHGAGRSPRREQEAGARVPVGPGLLVHMRRDSGFSCCNHSAEKVHVACPLAFPAFAGKPFGGFWSFREGGSAEREAVVTASGAEPPLSLRVPCAWPHFPPSPPCPVHSLFQLSNLYARPFCVCSPPLKRPLVGDPGHVCACRAIGPHRRARAARAACWAWPRSGTLEAGRRPETRLLWPLSHWIKEGVA